MFPTILHIGPISLHSYGLLVAIGFLTALKVLHKTGRNAGLQPHDVEKLAVELLLSGLIGARIFYFLVDGFSALRENPLSFFKIWEGGLVFYGGVIGAGVAAVYFSWRHRFKLLDLTDALVPPLLIGHAIGRLGCLMAGCCYGRPTGGWPGITFSHPDTLAPRHIALIPTQLMEAVGLGLLFVLTFRWASKKWPTGQLTVFYLLGYSVFRFLMEYLRGDDRGQFIMGLSPSQAISIVTFAAGLLIWIYGKKIRKS